MIKIFKNQPYAKTKSCNAEIFVQRRCRKYYQLNIGSTYNLKFKKILEETLLSLGLESTSYHENKLRAYEYFQSKRVFNFYTSKKWVELRKKILKKYGYVCLKCGAKDQIIHVDHIKPRSYYPELELDENNLQPLCRTCNIRKSNKNEIDYRPCSK